MKLLALLVWVTLAIAAPAPNGKHTINFNENHYKPQDVISRDICIIGGGATGTYAAIRLHDMGKSVVVVERDTMLGGHTRSYKIPESGEIVDFGVQAYSDTDIVHKFFGRFNIPLSQRNFTWGKTQWADFRTGNYIPDFKLPNASYDRFKALLEKYPELGWTSDLPEPVPEDLTLPFGEFVEKYSLEDIVSRLHFDIQGVGNILRVPTLYVFQLAGSEYLKAQETHVLVTTRRNNHEIFAQALKELDEDVLVSSNVIGAQRSYDDSGVKVIVVTPSGIKLIKAKKLLISVPPKMSNMIPFGIDEVEMSLFSQFSSKAWYVALVSNTSLPEGTTVANVNPYRSFDIPTLPALYRTIPTHVDGIFLVKYGSMYPVPDVLVKSEIRGALARLGSASYQGINKTASDIEILAFASHVPFELTVPPAAIENGFYRKLNALQGHRNTWYTGSAFLSAHSAALWNFTENLLPKIMDGL